VSGGRPLEHALPLLGARTYLHGTTLFDALMQHVPQAATVSFTIPRRIDSDRVAFIVEPGGDQQREGVSAKLAWRTDAGSGLIVVKPLPCSAEPRRVPYDEALVTDALVHGNRCVILEQASPFSFVATLIPMFKALLADATRPDSAGQWMFTRLDAKPPTQGFLPLQLKYEGMLGNSLARSAVECRRQRVGTLYFSWVPVPHGSLPEKVAS
jgi:hypothetical protein